MNTSHIILLAAALSASPVAFAQDATGIYAGVTLTTRDRAIVVSRTGERVADDGSGGAKIYVGKNFNDYFAVEAGFGDFGTHEFENVESTTTGKPGMHARSLYVAAKGSYPLGDRVALFGKLGVVHTRIDLSGIAADDVAMNRALVGIGGEFALTKKVALTLELNRYGEIRTAARHHFNINKVEAGIKFSF